MEPRLLSALWILTGVGLFAFLENSWRVLHDFAYWETRPGVIQYKGRRSNPTPNPKPALEPKRARNAYCARVQVSEVLKMRNLFPGKKSSHWQIPSQQE